MGLDSGKARVYPQAAGPSSMLLALLLGPLPHPTSLDCMPQVTMSSAPSALTRAFSPGGERAFWTGYEPCMFTGKPLAGLMGLGSGVEG